MPIALCALMVMEAYRAGRPAPLSLPDHCDGRFLTCPLLRYFRTCARLLTTAHNCALLLTAYYCSRLLTTAHYLLQTIVMVDSAIGASTAKILNMVLANAAWGRVTEAATEGGGPTWELASGEPSLESPQEGLKTYTQYGKSPTGMLTAVIGQPYPPLAPAV